jgi:hypothetical protein
MVVDIRERMAMFLPEGIGLSTEGTRACCVPHIAIKADFPFSQLRVKPLRRASARLGENKVNIATFHLGRDAPGGSAIALVQVDQPISPELIGKIAALEGVVQASR